MNEMPTAEGSGAISAPLSGPLSFITPLLGLGDHTEFVLSLVEGTDDLYTLAIDGAPAGSTPRLFLLNPGDYFLDYSPGIPPDVIAELAGEAPEESVRRVPEESVQGLAAGVADLAVLVVIHPADATSGPTANLLAPIIIHRPTRRAHQLVLDGAPWPLRAPLVPA